MDDKLLLSFIGYIVLALLSSSFGGPADDASDHVGSPGWQAVSDVVGGETSHGIDGMLDILMENQDIDGENNHIGDHGHLVEADIYEALEDEVEHEDGHVRKKRNALRDRASLWPGGAIPYVIDGYFSDAHKKHILGAMQRFHEKTCIRFVPRTIERDYILFQQSLGCWSMVGRTGGRQKISLAGTCRSSRGVIMHELMHAVGFRHEHNRPDRDGYISVYWQNIKEGFTTNFKKYSNDQVQTLGTGYDFQSLMHYPLTAFSKDGNTVTIGPRYPSYQIGDIGSQNDFSRIDTYRINYLYKCGECEDSDKYYCPIWAMMGECQANKQWMTKYCPFSCDRCKIALANGDGLACIDTTSNCKRWAKIGECERNPEYMLSNCRRSCKQCTATDSETGEDEGLACNDDNTLCYDWATLGECDSNAKFMKRHCRRSCHVCTGGDGRIVIDTEAPSCQDTSEECPVWVAKKMCKERREWMAERCRRSCLWCSPDVRYVPDTDSNKAELTRTNDEDLVDELKASEVEPGIVEGEVPIKEKGSDKTKSHVDYGNTWGLGGIWVLNASDVAKVPVASEDDLEEVIPPEEPTYQFKEPDEETETGNQEAPSCRRRDETDGDDGGGRDGDGDRDGDDRQNVQVLVVTPHDIDEQIGRGNTNVEPVNPNVLVPVVIPGGGGSRSGEIGSDSGEEGIHVENEIYGGTINTTGWWRPQGCVDEYEVCTSWARAGDCVTNPEWMAIKCPVSCGLCGDTGVEPACVDRHRNCSYWASIGECSAFPDWMHAKCPQSCGLCSGGNAAEEVSDPGGPRGLGGKGVCCAIAWSLKCINKPYC